jgi:hypothetical protein
VGPPSGHGRSVSAHPSIVPETGSDAATEVVGRVRLDGAVAFGATRVDPDVLVTVGVTVSLR